MENDVLEPNTAIEPKTASEKKLWRDALREGFSEGIDHAYSVYELAFNKLVADYRGILTFRRLEQEGRISMPKVSEGNLGIQVGRNMLSLDQKIFRITVPATFLEKER